MALSTIQIQELDGHGLRFQTGPQLVVNEALVDRPEPALTKKITRGEILRNHLEFLKREDVEIGALE